MPAFLLRRDFGVVVPRILVSVLFLSHALTVRSADDETQRVEKIEVIGQTPLPGLGVARDVIPANVQRVSKEAIEDGASFNLADIMKRNLGSVYVNEVQGNPFQPDVQYRGFSASPLLGTPQGLSIYMDGIRMNQPFGDVVSWDLIPRSAIASLALMPGSNPIFGLNTLGGAISIQTKNGYSHPGSMNQFQFGSHRRWTAEFEHGGYNDKGLHWFLSGNGFNEDGWRDFSPSAAGQLFGKLGWKGEKLDLSLSTSVANNQLTGNGLQEFRILDKQYSSIYSRPDETDNRSALFNLLGTYTTDNDNLLSGNVYYRRIKAATFNGDVNDDALDQSVYQPNDEEIEALASAGYSGFPLSGADASNTPFPFWRCLGNVLLQDEPTEKCNGLINRSASTQTNHGFSGQYTASGKLAGHKNQFTTGLAFDSSKTQFNQSSQFGYLNPDRSITPVEAFADGTFSEDGVPIDTRVDLKAKTDTWSVYFTDTWSVGNKLYMTASGRYNRTTVKNRDSLNPGGGSGSLDGDHRFSRFNPAIGITYSPTRTYNVYAGYNQGNRTPTAIELGCADPANPCKLPNALAGDPPLEQVVAKTAEAGMRGKLGLHTNWNASVFRTDNFDDILFVADNSAGFGYFKNFGKTRHQGFELGLDSQVGNIGFGMQYTYLDATYRSAEIVNGASNSSSDADSPGLEGNITIAPGDRMTLVPQHVMKAHADWQINRSWKVGFGAIAVSSSLLRGNENNQHQPDGEFYLGSGKTSGYAVFDMNAKYSPTNRLSFFAHIDNIFDRRYSTSGQLGATAFDPDGKFVARPFTAVGDEFPLLNSSFFAPGAPRRGWIGVRYQFGK